MRLDVKILQNQKNHSLDMYESKFLSIFIKYGERNHLYGYS